MALQDLDLFFFERWFEYYNIEFGTYDGTILLYFENSINRNKLFLNLDCICLLKGLTDVSDCIHVGGSLRSSFEIFTKNNWLLRVRLAVYYHWVGPVVLDFTLKC